MFQQEKVYKTLENRQFTAKSLRAELERMKKFDFESLSFTGLNLNLDMLMTQNIRDENFELIEVQGGLAKKTYDTWHHDLSLAISIYNKFVAFTKKHFDYYLKEAARYQEETGNKPSSKEYKAYFEQGNSMYFHDVLHSVFNISRRLDLSIEDFEEALASDKKNSADYPLPEKLVLEAKSASIN